MLPRDQQRLECILDYCEQIEDTLSRFGRFKETFLQDKDFQQSIAFSILQIGELVGKLSPELRSATAEKINWPQIKGMRNIVVHDYGEIDHNFVWDVIMKDIPGLKAFCESELPDL